MGRYIKSLELMSSGWFVNLHLESVVVNCQYKVQRDVTAWKWSKPSLDWKNKSTSSERDSKNVRCGQINCPDSFLKGAWWWAEERQRALEDHRRNKPVVDVIIISFCLFSVLLFLYLFINIDYLSSLICLPCTNSPIIPDTALPLAAQHFPSFPVS